MLVPVLATLVALLAVAAVAGAWLWQARFGLAEDWLVGQVRDMGIAEVTLSVTSLGLEGIDIRDVVLGPPATEAAPAEPAHVAAIDVAWSPRGLAEGRFDRVDVRGVRVAAAVTPDGIDLGPLAPLLEPGEGDGGPPALPAPEITVEDVVAEIATPQGPARIEVAGRVEETGPGALQARGEVGVTHDQFDAQVAASARGGLSAMEGRIDVRADARVPPLRLDDPVVIGGPVSFDASGVRAALHLDPVGFALEDPDPALAMRGTTPALDVTVAAPSEGSPSVHLRGAGGRVQNAEGDARGLALNLLIEDGAVDGDVRAARVSARAGGPPLEVDAYLRGPPEALSFRSVTAALGGGLALRASGVANAPAGAAEVAFALDPLVLGIPGARVVDLVPAAAEFGVQAHGQIEARGRGSVAPGAIDMRIEAALRDVGITTEAATLEGLNGALVLHGPDPLVTDGEQLISIAQADVGVPLRNGLVRFSLLPDNVLDVTSATFRMLGGEIRAGLTVTLGDALSADLVLVALSLDLGQILARVDLEGLSGSGTLSGAIPLRIRGDDIQVLDAVLLGDPEGGRIRYQPSAEAGAVAKSQADTLGLAVDALRDLHWTSLEVKLSGDARGPMVAHVHVRGSNPEFQDGRAVQLNLNVDARMSDLVRAGTASYRVPEVIEEKLREYGDRSPREGP